MNIIFSVSVNLSLSATFKLINYADRRIDYKWQAFVKKKKKKKKKETIKIMLSSSI